MSHLRVDGEYLPTKGWPRLDRFREHTIELPIAEVAVEPENEKQLRAAVEAAGASAPSRSSCTPINSVVAFM